MQLASVPKLLTCSERSFWPAVLDEAPGDVVAEPLPVFLFGVARRQPVPGLVEELACQWGTGCTALRRASPWFGSPCLQLRLDRIFQVQK